LETDKCPRQSKPISFPPAQFLDSFVNVFVNHLVDYLLFEAMDFRVLLLELISLRRLFFNEVKGHTNIAFSLCFEVKKAVGSLQLIKIPLNIIVIVHIFLQLGSPLSTLLFIHEILTVHIVKINSNLRSVRITLATTWHVLLILIKVKP
jgi:hypothetical protein